MGILNEELDTAVHSSWSVREKREDEVGGIPLTLRRMAEYIEIKLRELGVGSMKLLER
jgi:hypothetical protein